ncbi:MAG: hypothetical protein JWM47_4153 [Acidimicrobiales bacterium]|nr:hypothetical protein [Acidimicrobiales bacterium]
MSASPENGLSPLAAVSNAIVRLHKEQFGRGPTVARSQFAGPDMLLCALEDALLPAELKMAAMGEQQRVRESRIAFQAATHDEFVEAVERILERKVRAFGSAFDVGQNTVFEACMFEPRPDSGDDGGQPRVSSRACTPGACGGHRRSPVA